MKTRKYLIIAFLPVFISSIFTYLFYLKTEDKAFELVMEVKQSILEQVTNSVKAQFDFIDYDLRDISQREAIINLSEAGKKEIDLFYQTHDSVFISVTRIDKDGYISYSTPNKKVAGLYVGDQPHNKAVFLKKKPILSDVFTAVQGFKALAYAFPVMKNGVFDGTITVLIPIDRLGDLILKATNLHSYGHSLILSEGGYEIYCTFDKEHIGENVYDISGGFDDFISTVNKMLQKEKGRSSYWGIKSSADSLRILKWIVYKPIPLANTFWSLGVVTTEDEILGKMREVRSNLVIIISIAFATFVGLVLLYLYQSRKAEMALRRKDQKYRMVTERTGQLVYEYDFENKKVDWSGAIEHITGYTPYELSKFTLDELLREVHKEDKSFVLSKLVLASKNLSQYNIEYRLKRKDGDFIYVEDNGIFVNIEGTQKVKGFGTIKDITARKNAEQKLLQYSSQLEKQVELRTKRLEEVNVQLHNDIARRKEIERELIRAREMAETSDRLKSEFLAQVSHEIRTPINSILSFTSLIQNELEDKVIGDLSEGFNIVSASGRRITRTIDLILNMSELQTNSYLPNFSSFNLVTEILAGTVEEMSILAKSKNIRLFLVNNLNGKDPIIERDRYSISQIFINLIDNALKYTEKGKVEIVVRENADNKIIVEVEDTGIGIASEYISELFTAFSQEEQGYTRKFDGTGLGLALVKKYCEINNAEIEVESEKGKGSLFRVIFN